jgi:PAS domain S-box-containing protein
MDSMLVTLIALAAFYWICESFMFFFLEPEANFFQHFLGTDIFETWTRVLVLCLFVIFGSHFQHAVNKQRLADETFRRSEEKYSSILESIEEGCFEIDLEGNLTFFNDPLCRILGYSRKEMEGMNIEVFTSADALTKANQLFEQSKAGGEPINVTDYDGVRKNGRYAALELSASVIKNSDGQAVGFRGVLRDVSERKQTEEERRKLESQLQMAQKMESIGTLAGGIAHDFNNILMGIQGNASLMLLKIDSSHPNFEKAKNIERYVQNGTELTKQLLGFARRGKYNVKTTDLNDTIEKSSALFARTKKEIQVHTRLASDIWSVEIDRGQIDQALLNLYINAGQAMPDGGDLYLETENVELDHNYVKPYKVEPGKYVKITVADTGFGIDKANRKRIFEPFFTTKEMGRGTGLGLASVYGIIKNHGGYINVYSEINQGTTFTIYLPASEKTVLAEKESTAPIMKGTGTILLIDDEDMIIDTGEQLLKELGYSVLIARSGSDAIEVYKHNHKTIDLVVMDMIMPGMGGGDAFDRLKEINPEAKVLLSSGYSINGQATKIIERGCDGFIQKPFNMKQLSEKIHNIIGRK